MTGTLGTAIEELAASFAETRDHLRRLFDSLTVRRRQGELGGAPAQFFDALPCLRAQLVGVGRKILITPNST